ncbi:MAG: hypothetical protein Q8O12_00915 [Candidatus Omnitrophota bacterium]|nr:hypothetical protein [Candidatus Omnitrophota bacterium]
MSNCQKIKIPTKIISLISAQVFLLASLVYPAADNKQYSLCITGKANLRNPLDSSRVKETLDNLSPSAIRNIKATGLLTFLEELLDPPETKDQIEDYLGYLIGEKDKPEISLVGNFFIKNKIPKDDQIGILYTALGILDAQSEFASDGVAVKNGSGDEIETGQPGSGAGLIVSYMEQNPGCYIGFGDMKLIGGFNKAFTPGLVDKLIPLMIEAADKALMRYGGRAARIGGG